MSYGVHFPDLYRGAAAYVDKILAGANPGDLPIRQRTLCSEAVVETYENRRSGPAVARLLSRQRDINDIKHDRMIRNIHVNGVAYLSE